MPQPIHLGDAGIAIEMAAALLHRGIFVIAFSYPVSFMIKSAEF
jgi:7-keto-8-aminopelargonate synthetase-like enzyme